MPLNALFKLASRTLDKSAPLRNLCPIRFLSRAPITAETASDEISDSNIIHSNSSIRLPSASLSLITRPPDSTTPPPRSIVIPSSSTEPIPPVGADFTSTSWRPVVVLIMCKSTFEPASLFTALAPRFFISFSLAFFLEASFFASLARSFFSLRVNLVGRVYSSSSSQSSHSSSLVEGSCNSSSSSKSSQSSSSV